jgi:Tol biopolymer transport system component
VLGVAVVGGVTTFGVLVMRTRGSSNDASASPPAVIIPATCEAGPAGKIAFSSDRDGNREIYVMNADGSCQTNVTNGPGDDDFGAWSPDGSRIVFTSDRDGGDGKREVYVVNGDGSGQTRLSNNPCGENDVLAWSPDGSRLAFSSGLHAKFGSNPTVTPAAGDCVWTIYVVNADGSGLTNLASDRDGNEEFGAWSPDGSRIAFISSRAGNWDVYVVNADGSGLTNLSNRPADDFLRNNPGANGTAWSEDSSRVRFISIRDDGNRDLYVVNADGTGLTNLGYPGPDLGGGTSAGPSFDAGLSPISWGDSPDGARIAFFSNRDGNEELYVMNVDGSGVTRLTNNPASDANLVWSTDSSRIAFHSDRDGNPEIYVMNPDGSGLTNLSNGPGDDFLAAGGWSPDGSHIAFVSSRDGNGEIYVVNADGSGLTNLSNSPGEDSYPVWSPARH